MKKLVFILLLLSMQALAGDLHPRRGVVDWSTLQWWSENLDSLYSLAEAEMVVVGHGRAHGPHDYVLGEGCSHIRQNSTPVTNYPYKNLYDSLRAFNPEIKLFTTTNLWFSGLYYEPVGWDTLGYAGFVCGRHPYMVEHWQLLDNNLVYNAAGDTFRQDTNIYGGVRQRVAILSFLDAEQNVNRAYADALVDLIYKYNEHPRFPSFDGIFFDYLSSGMSVVPGQAIDPCPLFDPDLPARNPCVSPWTQNAAQVDSFYVFQLYFMQGLRNKFGPDFIIIANGNLHLYGGRHEPDNPIGHLFRPLINGVFYEFWPGSAWGWTSLKSFEVALDLETTIVPALGKTWSMMAHEKHYPSYLAICDRWARILGCMSGNLGRWEGWKTWPTRVGPPTRDTVRTWDLGNLRYYSRRYGTKIYGETFQISDGSLLAYWVEDCTPCGALPYAKNVRIIK